jgi:hypothetical protein
MPLRRCRRPLVALLAVLAVLYAQQFLTVHSLHHLGDPDPTHCVYAPLAAAAGGAVSHAAPVLAPPPPVVAEYPAPHRLHSLAQPASQRARAPPFA